eukprot:scaffold289386_cov40-Tisochrysis_lutea.AAC.2
MSTWPFNKNGADGRVFHSRLDVRSQLVRGLRRVVMMQVAFRDGVTMAHLRTSWHTPHISSSVGTDDTVAAVISRAR